MQDLKFQALSNQLLDALSPELRRNAVFDLARERLRPDQRVQVLDILLDPLGWGGLHDQHPQVRDSAADLASAVLTKVEGSYVREVARLATSWILGNDLDLNRTGAVLLGELSLDDHAFSEALSTALAKRSALLATVCSSKSFEHLSVVERLVDPLIEALNEPELQFFAAEMLARLAQAEPSFRGRIVQEFRIIASDQTASVLVRMCINQALLRFGEEPVTIPEWNEEERSDSSHDVAQALASFDYKRFEPVLLQGGVEAVLEDDGFRRLGASSQIHALNFLIHRVRDGAGRERILAGVTEILDSCDDAVELFQSLDALENFEGLAMQLLPYLDELVSRVGSRDDEERISVQSLEVKLQRVRAIIEWSYVPEVV